MRVRTHLFRFAVAFAAFISGFGFFCIGQYTKSAFSVKDQKTEILSAPVIVEQSEIPVVRQAKDADDSDEEAKYENSIDGYYGIAGEKSEMFEGFGWIEITTMNYENASEEDYEGTPIPPEGNIWIDGEFKFTKLSINNRFMAFETETIKGISYKFSGKYIEKAPFWKLDEQKSVLEGQLIKMKKGKKIAEKNISFFWYEDGC